MATNQMRGKPIAFTAASLLCGLAATATYSFGAKTTVPVKDSGTVQITLDRQERVISLADMVIGDSTTGTLRVENTGTSPADYRLSGRLVGTANALQDQLMLTVLKDGRQVFPVTGTAASLKAFNQVGADLGRFDRPCTSDPGKACDSSGKPSQWATGHRATLTFRVTLEGLGDGALDNGLQLLQANETFEITATKATSGHGTRK